MLHTWESRAGNRGAIASLRYSRTHQLITFHLADSLPAEVLEKISIQVKDLPEGQQKVEKQQRLQQLLDSGYGECHLRRPEVAASVEAILLERDAIDYRLFEWVSMPNHVHALVEVAAHAPLWKVVKGWKGASATTANRLVGSSGTFWWREYHDRFMRDEGHFHTSVAYVRNNPVKAGLCKLPEDWRFGSAYWREASE